MGIRGLKKWALLLTFWVALQSRWLRADDLSGRDLTLTGTADIQGTTISFGTSTGSTPGWQEAYLDGTISYVDFMGSRDANIWRWWQKAAGSAQLQLTLDNNNKLILYDQSLVPVPMITLDPMGTSSISNALTVSGSLTVNGTDNQMPNQTLTGAYSVLTEGLADARYLSITGSLVAIGSGNEGGGVPAGPTMSLNGGSASGYGYAFAEGLGSTATGPASVALGKSFAGSSYATATGTSTASGRWSTAMGRATASNSGATALGYSTASGRYSIAMGRSTATGNYSTASGHATASGTYSTASGHSTASGNYSMASGRYSTASGNYSTAFGNSGASEVASTAMGFSTASGHASTALGSSTASGYGSTALGWNSTASGKYSVAGGGNSTASGAYSTAVGFATASGYYSTALGYQVVAPSFGEFVVGMYNTGAFSTESTTAKGSVGGVTTSGIYVTGTTSNSWVGTDPVFEIGNGTAGTTSHYVLGTPYYYIPGYFTLTPDPNDPNGYYSDYLPPWSAPSYSNPYGINGYWNNGYTSFTPAYSGQTPSGYEGSYLVNDSPTVYSDAFVVYKNGNAAVQGNLTLAGLNSTGTITTAGISSSGVITAAPGGDIPMYSGH